MEWNKTKYNKKLGRLGKDRPNGIVIQRRTLDARPRKPPNPGLTQGLHRNLGRRPLPQPPGWAAPLPQAGTSSKGDTARGFF